MLYYRHNESQIRGTEKREGIEDHEGGGGGLKITPNTSVLSLSAAIKPNHKHGHVQISLKCTMAACGNVSRPWVFNARTRGNSLSPRNDSSDRLGNTNIEGGGINKQVTTNM